MVRGNKNSEFQTHFKFEKKNEIQYHFQVYNEVVTPYGIGYKSQSEYFLSGRLLKEQVLNVDARRKIREKAWKHCGCTIMSDG